MVVIHYQYYQNHSMNSSSNTLAHVAQYIPVCVTCVHVQCVCCVCVCVCMYMCVVCVCVCMCVLCCVCVVCMCMCVVCVVCMCVLCVCCIVYMCVCACVCVVCMCVCVCTKIILKFFLVIFMNVCPPHQFSRPQTPIQDITRWSSVRSVEAEHVATTISSVVWFCWCTCPQWTTVVALGYLFI